MERIINKMFEVALDNKEAVERNLKDWSRETAAMVGGLATALNCMGYMVIFEVDISGECPRISKLEVSEGGRCKSTTTDQPKQEVTIPKDLFLCRPLVELGETLKESCPHNDCTIYRNIYEMYCEKMADYKRILAACPDLADSTNRALLHAIRADEIQLYDMWQNNIAVNRKREAMRAERERKARIAAKSRE